MAIDHKKRGALLDPLSNEEMRLLAEAEESIKNGIDTLRIIAEWIKLIHDMRLFRASHPTFEAYCEDRLRISKSRSYQLLSWVKNVHPGGQTQPILTTEKASRAIAHLPPETQQVVIKKVLEAGDKPTAAKLKKAAEEFKPVEMAAGPPPPAVGPKLPDRVALALESDSFAALLADVRKLKASLKSLASEPLGIWLNLQRAVSGLQTVSDALKTARPYAPCPYCNGVGCKRCNTFGWVPQNTYEMAPIELQTWKVTA